MNAKNHEADSDLLTRAHLVPFAVFMAFMVILQLAASLIGWDHPDAPWWREDPAQWVYPLQTTITLVFLCRYWKFYRFDWSLRWSMMAVIFGAVGIGFWLLPTTLYDAWGMQGEATGWLKHLGFDARLEGFDPGIFDHPVAFWASLMMRFLRAVVVVALVEEVFWRGFLMRFVIDWDGDCWRQPFGRAHWKSYFLVTGLFVVAHAPVDYAGAFAYGTLAYVLCVWSKNLGACVVMHAVANFLMGLYIMAYGKFGLW